jgi:hypothetical protein
MTSIFCSNKSGQPLAPVLYELTRQEIKKLERGELKIRWRDLVTKQAMERGLIISQAQADLPEKRKLLEQTVCGHYACPYCKIKGTYIATATRYLELVHRHEFLYCTAADRMDCAAHLAQENPHLTQEEPKLHCLWIDEEVWAPGQAVQDWHLLRDHFQHSQGVT